MGILFRIQSEFTPETLKILSKSAPTGARAKAKNSDAQQHWPGNGARMLRLELPKIRTSQRLAFSKDLHFP